MRHITILKRKVLARNVGTPHPPSRTFSAAGAGSLRINGCVLLCIARFLDFLPAAMRLVMSPAIRPIMQAYMPFSRTHNIVLNYSAKIQVSCICAVLAR